MVLAKQKLEVAEFDAKEAEQYKIAQIRRADGDAEYKRKVMQADGALQEKIDVRLQAQEYYANAIKDHSGSWVPSVVMGNQGGTSGFGAQALVDLLTAKTAKELGLDMTMKGKTQTKGAE